ncbi:hypothetical protein BGX27_005480 [Mortierella sp. AM989]|nr:hypothetical protein BGX27_005480 [Mortierella sp. AM989]
MMNEQSSSLFSSSLGTTAAFAPNEASITAPSKAKEYLLDATLSPSNHDENEEILSSAKMSLDGLGSVAVESHKDKHMPSPQMTQSQEQKQERSSVSLSRQHIQYSYAHHHHQLHHHHHHHHHESTGDVQSDKKQKKNRRFSYSKVGAVPSPASQEQKALHGSQEPHQIQSHHQQLNAQGKDSRAVTGSSSTNNEIHVKMNNGSWGLLIDPTLKCCNVRSPPPSLKVSTTCAGSLSRGEGPWENPQGAKKEVNKKGSSPSSATMTCASPLVQVTTPSSDSSSSEKIKSRNDNFVERSSSVTSTVTLNSRSSHRHEPSTVIHNQEELGRPRVCKMLLKHPAVKLTWRVPEPIKAGGETLRGVLIISAKELSESEMKASISKKSKKKNSDCNLWIEHIEIDLTGVEEVTTGVGFLSRHRIDHHCFLHKTQALPVDELKRIHNSSSSSASSSVISPTSLTLPSVVATSLAPPSRSTSASSAMTSPVSAVSDFFQPGCIAPGTRQGIPFQMRVPEKVGGTFKSVHASISYQLIANVHVRYGKEAFVLQHPLPLSLFELVQIRAATKIASPHDLNPKSQDTSDNALASSNRPASFPSISNAMSPSSPSFPGRQSSGVRFVIPRANSVLGTAAVKPYTLWGLGPATSSQRHHYTYSSSHGYGRYQHQKNNHQRQMTFHSTPSSTSVNTASHMSGRSHGRMSRSHSASGSLGSQQFLNSEVNNVIPMMTDSHMLSAEDQYRQQHQQQHSQRGASRSSRHNLNRENADGLDEVGFGAHIDKSVAAAGDQVALDMFVVKSDLMKVVDIKVSLVETIQIFSLLDHDGACALVSPIASRARVFEMNGEGVGSEIPQKTSASKCRRRLVDTHVVKIAKDYVPAQSEESHANDNHLKGYYEDYEDFRTAKSLSMYKLNMRIPENALTILDRELLKVEYMFVIKFFFKGRMGAFLEVPIEIVSQYNHNRISTISGAISCVSNSVQIALPPIPILSNRNDNNRSDITSNNQSLSESRASSDIDASGDGSPGNTAGLNLEFFDEKDAVLTGCSKSVETMESELEGSQGEANSVEDTLERFSRRSSSSEPKSPTEIFVNRRLSKDTKTKLISVQQSALTRAEITEQAKAAKIAIEERKKEKDRIVATSRLSRRDSVEGESNVARLTAALLCNMDSEVATKELTRSKSNGNSATSSLRSRALAFEGEGIPKIVTNCANPRRSSTTSTSSSSSFSQRSPQFTESPLPITPLSATQSTVSSMGKNSIVSPTLPLLFDLTSAALPSPSLSSAATPIITKTPYESPTTSASSSASDCSSETTTATTVLTCPSPVSKNQNRFKDFDPTRQTQSQQFLHLRQTTSSTVGNSSSSSGSSTSSRDEEVSSHHNGFVAKIAKSLSSSPLLRSRAASGSGATSSPSGSTSNLATLAQHSSAFTLAATTLSAFTLLPSIGQSASGSDGSSSSGNGGAHHHRHNHHRHHVTRRSSQQFLSPPQPLKSCLKRRCLSVPPNTLLSAHPAETPTTITVATNTLKAPQQPVQNKKKVTFAKGSTPQPSPTTSQIFVHDADQIIAARINLQYPQSYALSGNLGANYGQPSSGPIVYTGQQRSAPIVGNATASSHNHYNMTAAGAIHQSTIGSGTTSAAVAAGAVMRSPNSASPRSRLHHPFDGHPSRLSPLEKQRLDFRIKNQSPLRNGSNGVHAMQQHQQQQQQQQRVIQAAQSKGQRDTEVNLEEEEEGRDYDEEDDEEMEYEDEDDEEEEDDERESEEERIERRRQVRVAWLAKYGDAFKQVYGAVPELPPI